MPKWAFWDADLCSLTISRPSELTHEQLESIWSPLINTAINDSIIAAIDRAIDEQVATIRARSEQERQEQRRRQEEDDRRRREAEAERQRRQVAERQAADEKAEVLLARSLTEQQREDLRTKDYFLVRMKEETYKIKRGFAGNVKLLDAEGREVKSFCIHPTERVPDADAMLAQKLMLETDIERFHKIANVTNLTPQTDRRAA